MRDIRSLEIWNKYEKRVFYILNFTWNNNWMRNTRSSEILKPIDNQHKPGGISELIKFWQANKNFWFMSTLQLNVPQCIEKWQKLICRVWKFWKQSQKCNKTYYKLVSSVFVKTVISNSRNNFRNWISLVQHNLLYVSKSILQGNISPDSPLIKKINILKETLTNFKTY